MAIITKPTIVKGQANEFDLSKSELALLSKVVNDSYFSDQTNWSKVIIQYKSAEGNQHEMMIFDASEASPKGNFEVSEKARDSWEVQSVKIMDFDGGYLKLERGDLTVADFDILLLSVVGEVTWQSVHANITEGTNSVTGNTGSTYMYSNEFILTGSESGYIEFIMDNSLSTDTAQLGLMRDGASAYGGNFYFNTNGTVQPTVNAVRVGSAIAYSDGDKFKVAYDHTVGSFGEYEFFINDVSVASNVSAFADLNHNHYFSLFIGNADSVTVSGIKLVK